MSKLYKWLDIAMKEQGQKEVKGKNFNPRIVEYHSVTTLKATSDEVPWCSSFVSWCLEKAGVKSTRSAAAKSYETWGDPLEKPIEGCIVVLTRGNGDERHVGFFVGENSTMITLLGGNQADKVGVDWFLKTRVLAYRWPSEFKRGVA